MSGSRPDGGSLEVSSCNAQRSPQLCCPSLSWAARPLSRWSPPIRSRGLRRAQPRAPQGAAVAGPVGAIVGTPLGLAAGAVAGTVGAVGTVGGAVAGGPLVVNVTPGGAPAAVGAPAGIGTPV